jgi:hypothetical protein
LSSKLLNRSLVDRLLSVDGLRDINILRNVNVLSKRLGNGVRDGSVDENFDGDLDLSVYGTDDFDRVRDRTLLHNLDLVLLDTLNRNRNININGDGANNFDRDINVTGNLSGHLDGVGSGDIDEHLVLSGDRNFDRERDSDLNRHGNINIVGSGNRDTDRVLSGNRNLDCLRLFIHDSFNIERDRVGNLDTHFTVKVFFNLDGDSAFDSADNFDGHRDGDLDVERSGNRDGHLVRDGDGNLNRYLAGNLDGNLNLNLIRLRNFIRDINRDGDVTVLRNGDQALDRNGNVTVLRNIDVHRDVSVSCERLRLRNINVLSGEVRLRNIDINISGERLRNRDLNLTRNRHIDLSGNLNRNGDLSGNRHVTSNYLRSLLDKLLNGLEKLLRCIGKRSTKVLVRGTVRTRGKRRIPKVVTKVGSVGEATETGDASTGRAYKSDDNQQLHLNTDRHLVDTHLFIFSFLRR